MFSISWALEIQHLLNGRGLDEVLAKQCVDPFSGHRPADQGTCGWEKRGLTKQHKIQESPLQQCGQALGLLAARQGQHWGKPQAEVTQQQWLIEAVEPAQLARHQSQTHLL